MGVKGCLKGVEIELKLDSASDVCSDCEVVSAFLITMMLNMIIYSMIISVS